MTTTPYDALRRLRSPETTGEVDAVCARHQLGLLVVHGSVLESAPLRPARDLDIAFQHLSGSRADVVGIVNELMEITGFDRIDPMDLGRAGVVARARALGPHSLTLYEAIPGTFVTAQMAALTTEMETRYLRRLDLELMAGR